MNEKITNTGKTLGLQLFPFFASWNKCYEYDTVMLKRA